MTPALDIENLVFSYRNGEPVLDIPSLSLERGSQTFLYGPSGSGKTTLLGLMAGVLQATKGSIRVLGQDLSGLPGGRRDAFRAAHIGYVFQMFNLIPYLSVLENITLPCRLNPIRKQRLEGRGLADVARELADHLEISHVLGNPVTELSVGQQQRVAACRALMGAPELVIADEPTSALDYDRREAFLSLLFQECSRAGASLVFVSHDRSLEDLFSNKVSLTDVNRVGVS